MKVTISDEIKGLCPNLIISCLRKEVKFKPNDKELWQKIDAEVKIIQEYLQTNAIAQEPNINAARKAYKTLGKDPSRYRLSAEALLRRIKNGKGIYQINNLVDALNLVSIKTGISIGGYDCQKIVGDISLGIGQKDEKYEAIGRGNFNIDRLPVLRDSISAFGSPTSDSTRTMVQPSCQEFLMIFFDFGGDTDFKPIFQLVHDLLN